MIFSGKRIDEISAENIKGLLEAGVPEGKEVDYKQNLPANDNEGKKEFLADVSSFANTTGGYLIFGIREENLIPVEICGLPNLNPDIDIQRLENMIRDGIDPRIQGVATRAVQMDGSKYVVLIHIPQSFLQPHVVRFQNHWRFYARNSAGKYPLDVDEVRSAFLLSESIAEQIRQFRADRLGKILSGDTPIEMLKVPTLVIHVVPAGACRLEHRIDLSQLADKWGDWLLPIKSGSASYRYNFDGFLSWAINQKGPSHSYIQLFHNGCIEAVLCFSLGAKDEQKIMPAKWLEGVIIKELERFQRFAAMLGIVPPLFVLVSIFGVAGYVIRTGMWDFDSSEPIDRDNLIFSEILFTDFEVNPADLMKPVFDALWNAGGFPGSISYKDGKWEGDKK